MRDYELEFHDRVEFIRKLLEDSGCKGIVYGNSGGKDSLLVGALCKAACDNTVGIIMPCSAKRNFNEDAEDAYIIGRHFGIETRYIDLSPTYNVELEKLAEITELNKMAKINLASRIRMMTLYAVAASEGRLVAGTGNRSEGYVGYFTKWGDGAHDFNPISDLTVTEIYEFLHYLDAPEFIFTKAPSAALFDGQTDEGEMGFTYKELDDYILYGKVDEELKPIIDRMHRTSEHKRKDIARFKN